MHRAIGREKEIKGWPRIKKIALIASVNPTWKDLSEGWYERHEFQPASAQVLRFAQDDRDKISRLEPVNGSSQTDDFSCSERAEILALWASNILLLVYANWRDSKNGGLPDQQRKLGKRAFATVLVSYVLLVAGPIVSNLSGSFEKSGAVFLLLTLVPWLIAFVCALAGFAFGMRSKGWTRIAAMVSGTVMIGFMAWVFLRGHV